MIIRSNDFTSGVLLPINWSRSRVILLFPVFRQVLLGLSQDLYNSRAIFWPQMRIFFGLFRAGENIP